MSCVYTVKTAYTNAFFTIRSTTSNGEKPSMVAFKNKKDASRFVIMRNGLLDTKKRQPLKIEQIPMTSLSRRCALNALELCVYDENLNCIVYEPLDYPDDNYTFHLENVIMYYTNGNSSN